MKNFQEKAKAIWNIVQTLVMFLVGLVGIGAGLLFDQREDLRFVSFLIGGITAVIGFVPMFTALVKTNWPK